MTKDLQAVFKAASWVGLHTRWGIATMPKRDDPETVTILIRHHASDRYVIIEMPAEDWTHMPTGLLAVMCVEPALGSFKVPISRDVRTTEARQLIEWARAERVG